MRLHMVIGMLFNEYNKITHSVKEHHANQRLVIDTYRVGAHFIRLTSCSLLKGVLINVTVVKTRLKCS